MLLNDIRYHCPNGKILMSSIPPRKTDIAAMARIRNLNTELEKMANPELDIHYINVVPQTSKYFTAGRVHFNQSGLSHYGFRLAGELKNF